MLHFPSTLKNTSQHMPRRSDSLNATQQKPASHPIFLIIEEELHDARRVHSHGQEEDLRLALDMVIGRVSELSSLLSEAYKSRADLEVQLNVAKSNLQLVISNNEMLEEALKRDSSGHSKDVGWRRWSSREGEHREQRVSEERQHPADYPSGLEGSAPSPMSTSDNRFFKFRFTASSPNPSSRPGTPSDIRSPAMTLNGFSHHLNSPSVPSLPSQVNRELEELNVELQKERAARKTVTDEKAALEAEIESLSQALFEEANKMVATERIKRAETEEELKEARLEKEALRSALRLLEGENEHLRVSSVDTSPVVEFVSPARSHSSPQVGARSLSASPSPPLTPSYSKPPSNRCSLPPYVAEHASTGTIHEHPSKSSESRDDGDTQVTPQFRRSRPPSLHLEELGASPWADVSSKLPLPPPSFPLPPPPSSPPPELETTVLPHHMR